MTLESAASERSQSSLSSEYWQPGDNWYIFFWLIPCDKLMKRAWMNAGEWGGAKQEWYQWLTIYFSSTFPQYSIFRDTIQKKLDKQKRKHHIHTYNLIWNPHIHTSVPSRVDRTTHSGRNINKVMCSSQDVFFNFPGFFFYSLDWLEQTSISNTMPHAT